MKVLLWFILLLLSTIPAVTCVVYYFRRLNVRREQLRQTLISMQLREAYMMARHGEIRPIERLNKFEERFKADFRAGLALKDYIWPVALVTVISSVGWFLTFSLVDPAFTSVSNANSFFPTPFGWGFAGAYAASLITIFDAFRTLNLDPITFYSIAYRILFSSTGAYVVSAAGVFTTPFAPVVGFGIGLFPAQQTWKVITDKAAQVVGSANKEGEPGAALASIQGLEDQRNRQKLVDVDISTVQGLATADPFWLFFQTTLPLRTIIDMMDKAILHQYIGDASLELRKHGINGVIELVALVPLANNMAAYSQSGGTSEANKFFKDSNPEQLLENLIKVLGQEREELRAFIYNLYYDPLVRLLYDMWGKYLTEEAETQAAQAAAATAAIPPQASTAAAAGASAGRSMN